MSATLTPILTVLFLSILSSFIERGLFIFHSLNFIIALYLMASIDFDYNPNSGNVGTFFKCE